MRTTRHSERSDRWLIADAIWLAVGFYTLPQAEIYPMLDDHGELIEETPFWQLRDGQEPHPFSWPEMFYLEHGTMRGAGFYPTTPVDAIQVSVDSVIAAERYVRGFFRSGAKFGMVFEKEGEWSEEEALEFVTWVQQEFMNVDTSHRPFALWGGLHLKDALPQNAHDFTKMIELWAADLNKVCGRFNIDPTLVSAVPRGGHLGGQSDRQQKWIEAMLGPINNRKSEFSDAVTYQFFRQGFGITDWDFELVKYRHAQDAATMLAVAQAYAAAKSSGIVDWSRLPDLNTSRKIFDPDLELITEEEHAKFLENTKPPPPPAQLPPRESLDINTDPAKTKPPAETQSQRDRRATPAQRAMSAWSAETEASVIPRLKESIAKGIALLKPIYDESHRKTSRRRCSSRHRRTSCRPVARSEPTSGSRSRRTSTSRSRSRPPRSRRRRRRPRARGHPRRTPATARWTTSSKRMPTTCSRAGSMTRSPRRWQRARCV